MVKALAENQIDIGVLLTEGALKAAADKGIFKIVQVYVNSPLYWGIYTGINSTVSTLDSIQKPVFCISRMGSGSHLMAYLLCKEQGWNSQDIDFVEVGNFSGALKELNSNPNYLFLWERFMTKPYVDSGSLKKLGEIPTPWASFSIVVKNEILEKYEDEMALFIQLLSDYTYKFKQNTLESIDYISSYFDFSVNDMKEWIISTDWNYVLDRPQPKLIKALDFLQEMNLVSKEVELNQLCPDTHFWTKCAI